MKMKKLLLVIHASLCSNELLRIPLLRLSGKNVLWHVWNRMSPLFSLHNTVLVTSSHQEDRELINWAKKQGMYCHIDKNDDPIEHLLHLSECFASKILVQISGNAPLIDPILIESMIQQFVHTYPDFLSAREHSGFPSGLTANIFYQSALKKAKKLFKKKEERRHFLSLVYRQPYSRHFCAMRLLATDPYRYPKWNFLIKREEEWQLIKNIYENLYKGITIPLTEVFSFLQKTQRIVDNSKHCSHSLIH